jgi:hypothetical protein
MKKNFVISILVVSIVFLVSLSVSTAQEKAPLTVAEESDFTATSRYVDVSVYPSAPLRKKPR